MQPITSEYLSASAGSGKTYRLSQRFCRLVMAGVPPEEICALTFTRPATREIFSAVIKRLLEDKTLDGDTSFTRAEALARVLAVLPQLQISTIDAFSAKVARLFAYEIGLDPAFSLYDGGNSPEARALVREMLSRAFQQTDQQSADELLATFDIQDRALAESRPLSQQWKDFWAKYASVLEDHPDGWGEIKRLGACLQSRCDDALSLVEKARALVERLSDTGTVEKRAIKKLHDLLSGYHAEVTSLRQLKAIWAEKGGGDWKDSPLFQDCAESHGFTYYKKSVTLDEDLSKCFEALWYDLITRDLEQASRHTRALHRALAALKRAEKQLLDERSMVSFDTITRTLAAKIGGNLSVRDANAFYVAYRLDSAIRHLMIDEFQDTSTAQWQVLSGVANELAEEKDSTFFYVGDTKQSIYAWRGGDPTLFADTTRLPDIPAGAPLVNSYRSVQTVIDFVNRVMKLNLSAITNKDLEWQRPSLEKWNQNWDDHTSAIKGAGYVQLVSLGGNKSVWIANAARMIAARWRQLSKKKLSIAVMAATNTVLQGDEGLLSYLRQEGVPCAIDGKRNIAETPIGTLVLHLLQWMADPRSTFYRGIATLLGIVTEDDAKTLNAWSKLINKGGFTLWLDFLFGEEQPIRKQLSAMDLTVLDAIRHSFEQFDQEGKIEPAEARTVLDALQVPCSADENVVNLMTMHHSKGLTFDVVFSIFSGDIASDSRVDYEVGEDWVLERPVLSETYQYTPALEEARQQRKNARIYDILCMSYVAITRARFEQVVLAPTKDASNLSKRAGWLYEQFPDAYTPTCEGLADTTVDLLPAGKDVTAINHYCDGDVNWWQTHEDRVTTETPTTETFTWKREDVNDALEVDLPSEHAKAKSISDMLGLHATSARTFGTSFHEELSAIEWTETPPKGLFPEVFRKPTDETCELWRERPFSVCLKAAEGNSYMAGQFDRVHLFPERRSAIIYDYKTSYSAEVTSAYREQLGKYRQALAVLTGYDVADIRTILLFTRHHQAIEVTYE